MRDTEQSPKPSRRSIIAAALAATAAAVPAAAIAASARHPDHELIELGRRYAELLAIEEEAYAEFNRCSDQYTSKEPVPRDSMRHTIKDVFDQLVPPRQGRTVSAVISNSDFYTDDEVEI